MLEHKWNIPFIGGNMPQAQLHLANGSVADAPDSFDHIVSFAVGNRFRRVAGAVFVTVAFWIFLLRVGTSRGSGGDRVPRIVSSKSGYASLSQLQILVVIGGSAIYATMLSGRALDIPAATLGLLGITGISTATAALQPAA